MDTSIGIQKVIKDMLTFLTLIPIQYTVFFWPAPPLADAVPRAVRLPELSTSTALLPRDGHATGAGPSFELLCHVHGALSCYHLACITLGWGISREKQNVSAHASFRCSSEPNFLCELSLSARSFPVVEVRFVLESCVAKPYSESSRRWLPHGTRSYWKRPMRGKCRVSQTPYLVAMSWWGSSGVAVSNTDSACRMPLRASISRVLV